MLRVLRVSRPWRDMPEQCGETALLLKSFLYLATVRLWPESPVNAS